jgi:ABC-type lipoprotein release transport system permease subunit
MFYTRAKSVKHQFYTHRKEPEERQNSFLATVTSGLIATAATANYIPARRAMTMDPVEALRPE